MLLAQQAGHAEACPGLQRGEGGATGDFGQSLETTVIVPVAWGTKPAVAPAQPTSASALRVTVGRYCVHVDGDFAPEVLGKLVQTLEVL